MGALTSITVHKGGAASAAPLFECAVPAPTIAPRRYSLYEYVADVERIADIVDALDRAGDLDPETSRQLESALVTAITGTKEKVDRTASVLASFEAAEEAARREIARLEERAKYFARQRDRLAGYCIAVIESAAQTRIDGNTASLVVTRNPASVVIDAGVQLAPEFMRTPPAPAPEPDKAVIKLALKRGEYVPGCRLVQKRKLEVR